MNGTAEGLCVENVHVWRGDRHVLKGVSVEVGPRELVHVLGPNGTGKTTLLRVATGLLRPEHGRVLWRGRAISSVRSDYQSALAYVSHEPALKADLTPLENLRFMVGLKRRVSTSELKAHLDRTGVLACADLPVRVLSAGQRRRVVMARVLALGAAIWLLDEPFTNLDAAGTELVATLLAEHVNSGGLALVVAHQNLQVSATTRRLELAT
ncbi:MAG TPA: cytochrome c biogenesis heme-transporting ATPase CcmA [Steroidobacteraceae bacterium]|nr:cytochrome c biogenesis heme-transporting ATPase CcmA [Steroidobacteraceae bacterium]